MKVLVCIKCGSDWKGNGSPAICPDCSEMTRTKDNPAGTKVLSCAIVKEVPDGN